MPEPLATPEELATFLRTASQEEAEAGSGDVLDTGTALLALQSASGAIRSVCGWNISQETVTETLTGSVTFLTTLNLTAVAVTANGSPVSDGLSWTRNGTVRLSTARWWLFPGTITYTHGYDPVPDGVRAVCLELAARLYINPEQYVSVTRGTVTDVFASSQTRPADLREDPRLVPYMMLPGVA